MKPLLLLLAILMAGFCMAQTSRLQKGKKVFIAAAAGGTHEATVTAELARQLKAWDFWQLTTRRSTADLIVHLEVQTHRGVTAWSWGGVTTKASLWIEDKAGETIWQSKQYKANPNGTNSFNTARATIGKIVKELKTAAAKDG